MPETAWGCCNGLEAKSLDRLQRSEGSPVPLQAWGPRERNLLLRSPKQLKGRSCCQQRKSGSQEGASKSRGRQTLSSGSDGLRGGDGAPAWPKDGREGAHLELPQGEDCRRHRTPGTGGP